MCLLVYVSGHPINNIVEETGSAFEDIKKANECM